jgi:hypothetical protein
MANTFTKIASVSLSSAASSIDFTSIPSTYTDLCLKVSSRNAVGTVLLYVRMNGDTGNNYSARRFYATGSTVASNSSSGANSIVIYGGSTASDYTASTFSNAEIYIPNYANTSYAKSVSIDGVTENNATEAYSTLDASLWNSTAAITSISLFYTSFNQVQYSTAVLYGIKKS